MILSADLLISENWLMFTNAEIIIYINTFTYNTWCTDSSLLKDTDRKANRGVLERLDPSTAKNFRPEGQYFCFCFYPFKCKRMYCILSLVSCVPCKSLNRKYIIRKLKTNHSLQNLSNLLNKFWLISYKGNTV